MRRGPVAAAGARGEVALRVLAAEPRQDPGDAEVVQRVLRGEKELYGLLVQRHGDLLYRHALRMTRQPDEAADLVQATFLKAYRSLRTCDPERFGGWIFRILSNFCLDHLRDPRRGHAPLDEAAVGGDPAPGPAESLERSELGRTLEAALARLTPEQREAFLLKHLEGYSYEEMAELLGVAPAALKMRVHRARDALQGLLGESR